MQTSVLDNFTFLVCHSEEYRKLTAVQGNMESACQSASRAGHSGNSKTHGARNTTSRPFDNLAVEIGCWLPWTGKNLSCRVLKLQIMEWKCRRVISSSHRSEPLLPPEARVCFKGRSEEFLCQARLHFGRHQFKAAMTGMSVQGREVFTRLSGK